MKQDPAEMQQGRGGMGGHKHGVSGHASQSPRLRLFKKLAAERGEYQARSSRTAKPLQYETVQDALEAERRPRRRRT
jgi:hypothetical protein